MTSRLSRRALGTGVGAYGASPLTLTDVVVTRTRPGADGRGVGIHLAPSALMSPERSEELSAYLAAEVAPLSDAPAPDVKMADCRVEDATGMGIWVEGATATIEGASVRRVHSGPFFASGIRVEPRAHGLTPARLSLRHSVISSVEGIGVHVEDSEAVIEDVTIHDIEGRGPKEVTVPTGSCLGQGIRARARLPEELGPEGDRGITLRRTVIDGVRESAVHLEGVSATVEDSILRNVRGCGDALGDGVVAYGYDFSPASVAVNRTLVGSVARSAVATFSADVVLDSVALSGCEPFGTLPGGGAPDDVASSLCWCDGAWAPCEARTAERPPALVGFPECNPDEHACVESCFTALLAGPGAPRLARLSTWNPIEPAVATAVADSQGCFAAPQIAETTWRSVAFLPGYTPGAWWSKVTRSGRVVIPQGSLVWAGALYIQSTLFPERDIPDLRNAAFINFEACKPPAGELAESIEVCFSGGGVPGVQGELLTAEGEPLDAPWARPIYFTEESSSPDPSLTATTSNSAGYFYDVPPGEYLLRLRASGDRTLQCDLDPSGLGMETGIEAGENSYRVHADAGWNITGVRAFCTME